MLIASRPSLRYSALAIAAVAAALAAAVAAPASGASTADCAKEVIADWYDNGRVDKLYPLHCYREAIKILPVDVRDYSSARDDILRALAYARQGKKDPGGSSGENPSGNPSDPGGNPPGSGPGGGNPSDPSDPGANPVDTSGPSAVPIPLIVLAAIATLLLVLGAVGYFTRRAAGRGDDGPPA